MTTVVETPQARCRAGFARADITPPVGIYHRMWGAAEHDRATGVHRPLTATALYLAPFEGAAGVLVLGLDHCLFDRDEFERIRERVAREVGLKPSDIQVSMSHTHGSAWMSRTRAHLPGGDMIGPYLDGMIETCARIAREAASGLRSATVVYGTARCALARHRDFWDSVSKQFVCGFNPEGPADDAVLLAKVTADDGAVLGTIVNYACHPTTLAWQNTLISPDYVGAMQEVVEKETGAPCLFLQGASGDLGPVEGFVGDPATADKNGRQLGFAALSGLEALPPPGTRFEYAGPVVSGAILGTWKHEPSPADSTWHQHECTVNLQYRLDLPTVEQTRADLAKWEAEDSADSRAKAEQMTRQLTRLAALHPGAYQFRVQILRLGRSLWLFAPGELYQEFQLALRKRFPRFAVVVATITNDWQPGYLPSASSYGYGIYQDVIAAVAPGSLEVLIECVGRDVERLIAKDETAGSDA